MSLTVSKPDKQSVLMQALKERESHLKGLIHDLSNKCAVATNEELVALRDAATELWCVEELILEHSVVDKSAQ